MNGNRPRLTIHYAQTLDGRIATRTGDARWISGEASLRLAHELRAAHGAVLVGVGTVLADNPRLTVRLPAPAREEPSADRNTTPRRVVADSTLRLPLTANVLTDGAAPTLIATTARAPAKRIDAVRRCGADVVVVNADAEGHVDLGDLLRCLAARGISTVLLEGGHGLITTALRDRLVDRLTVCIAPKVLGAGIDAVGDLAIHRLAEALTFAQARFTPLGEDVIFDGQLA